MTFDDLVYVFLLLLSLCLGPLMRRSGKFRSILSPMLGFLIAFVATGFTIWHSMATVFGFVIIMNLCPPSFLHYVAVPWCFGYLGFFRTCHYFDFAPNPPVANAVQLIITLRLIGIAFEIVDSWRVNQKLTQLNEKSGDPAERERLLLVKKFKNIHVSAFDVICYAYCYIGLFTGPYYKYRTFQDFVNWPLNTFFSNDQLLQRLQEAPFFGVPYLILSHFYTVDYVRTEEFYERPFSYRFFYMMITLAVFRLRIYFAWKVAESTCIAAGLGAYPRSSEPVSGEGPTNLPALKNWIANHNLDTDLNQHTSNNRGQGDVQKITNCLPTQTTVNQLTADSSYDFTTINNISVWGCEFSPTVREGMRSWNRSVQYWLATNFNKRCPGSRLTRNAWTMLVSAYWHGFHPGYYLSFLTIPLALNAESNLAYLVNTFGRSLPDGTLAFLSWLIKMRVFEYCSMGFLLLDAKTTLTYWHSIGFCVHILLLGLIVIGFLASRFVPPPLYSAYRDLRAHHELQKAEEEKKGLLRTSRL